MNNFTYFCPTKVYFGDNSTTEAFKYESNNFGKRVMLAYGEGSIKQNGIYDEIRKLLVQSGKEVIEFSGIMSNPTYVKV